MDRLDSGTGVFRYEYFLELAKRDFMMARRDKRMLAVVLFDIVDLDAYGQPFGSKAADSCLRMVAAQVSRARRSAITTTGPESPLRRQRVAPTQAAGVKSSSRDSGSSG
jgi:PleD family two-component response regulator